MIDAKTLLDKRLGVFLLESDTEDEAHAAFAKDMLDLLRQIGYRITHPNDFSRALTSLWSGYQISYCLAIKEAAFKEAASAAQAAANTGVATFFTADELWAAEARYLRLSRELKQTELAEQTGGVISNSQISEYETYKSFPAQEVRAQVDDVLRNPVTPPLQLPLKDCQ
jgi:hypothetical protein